MELEPREGTFLDRIKRLEAENAALRDKMQRIMTWCDAYPLDIFPEPDFKIAHELLKAGGMTLDAISASNMRHVLDGIRDIINGDNGDAGI